MSEKKSNNLTLNVLLKHEDDLFVAHCLELDIISADPSADKAKKEMLDLISAQIDYAFSNDNLDNLFHSAPTEAWEDFYNCNKLCENKIRIESRFQPDDETNRFVPPTIIAKICMLEKACGV